MGITVATSGIALGSVAACSSAGAAYLYRASGKWEEAICGAIGGGAVGSLVGITGASVYGYEMLKDDESNTPNASNDTDLC